MSKLLLSASPKAGWRTRRVRSNASTIGLRSLALAATVAFAGCASVPPERVDFDRMQYSQAIADSWKRQTLLNVVRMRYADPPVFLDVSSIINTYSVAGKGSLGTAQLAAPGVDSVTLGVEGSWSNTPTVTYQPVAGDRFTRSLLQPVPPASVFQLLQSGWPADVVLPVVVNSINGLRNASFGKPADSGFGELVAIMTRIQRAGGLGIRVEARKDGSAVVFTLPRPGQQPEIQADGQRVRTLLGVDERASEFDVTYGLYPGGGRNVALLTRSMLELMLELGVGIELPEGHAEQGRVLPYRRTGAEAQKTGLVRIRSGTEAPRDAYADVVYRSYRFWIDDTDIASKRSFTFLMILSSLAETGQTSVAPLVTVPSR